MAEILVTSGMIFQEPGGRMFVGFTWITELLLITEYLLDIRYYLLDTLPLIQLHG